MKKYLILCLLFVSGCSTYINHNRPVKVVKIEGYGNSSYCMIQTYSPTDNGAILVDDGYAIRYVSFSDSCSKFAIGDTVQLLLVKVSR